MATWSFGSTGWLSRLSLMAVLWMPFMASADPAHYFVVKEAANGELSIVSHQLVTLSGPVESSPSLPQPSRSEAQISATLHDKVSGNTLFTAATSTSAWLRAEHQGIGKIKGQQFPVADRIYVIRVPVKSGSVMRLKGFRRAQRDPTWQGPYDGALASSSATDGATFTLDVELDSYAPPARDTNGSPRAIEVAPAPLSPGSSSGNIYLNGSPSNRLDVLIVAEGYTAAQQSQFVQQASVLADGFLSISPYSDFRQLINVSWLFVPSNQSGADKPTCAETPGSNVIMVDTAFDASFCYNGIRRAVTVNNAKVFTAAATVPDWDKILVLVNDTEYGGTGGSLAVGTTNAASVGIMQHEFGHSFTLLADEYSDAGSGTTACSDVTANRPCEPNVSDQTNRSALKWRGWVADTTPIPTLNAQADPLAAGLWEGARYQTSGMYRQCFNGIMRNLGQPFCRVDREAFVKRLYGGGWGTPSGGVRLIEPGALPSDAKIRAQARTDIQFRASLAGSNSAGGLAATWLVDGIVSRVDASRHGSLVSFTYRIPDARPHTIELRVSDSTPLVLVTPVSSQVWTTVGTSMRAIVPFLLD